MSEFMKILLSLSVSGSLLLLLVLGLKPLYKNSFSRRWQYYIWIIVALRFLLPFTPDATIVGSLFERFDRAAITSETPVNANALLSVSADDSETEPIPADITAAMREPFEIYSCLFLIWAALASALFVRKVTVYQGFIRYIKAGNTEVSDIRILNLLSDCEEKLNIKARVELSRNPLVSSPMLIGFFRPRIILPDGKLEDKELSYIFTHELIHCKRGDMFYKWLIQIVVCAHWFNPFVYLLEKEVNKSCELSCDEKVISALDDNARREYGDTLISFLKSDNPRRGSLASVTLTEGAEQIKERLGAIMKFKKKTKGIIAAAAALTFAVCLCFLAVGAYSAADNGTETAFNGNNVSPEDYAIYESFGLSVDNGKLYYEGKPVRCFDDRMPAKGFSVKAIGYYEKNGAIDVCAVRENINGVSELTGLKALSQDEFESRAIADHSKSASLAGGNIFAVYEEYGLRYDESSKALFYDGKRVRLFWDSRSADSRPSDSEDLFGNSVSNWDSAGEIDLYTVRDFEQTDENGYGKLNGFRIAAQEEFEANTKEFSNQNNAVETAE